MVSCRWILLSLWDDRERISCNRNKCWSLCLSVEDWVMSLMMGWVQVVHRQGSSLLMGSLLLHVDNLLKVWSFLDHNLTLLHAPSSMRSRISLLQTGLGLSGSTWDSPPRTWRVGSLLMPHFEHLLSANVPRFEICTTSLTAQYIGLFSVLSMTARTLGLLPPWTWTEWTTRALLVSPWSRATTFCWCLCQLNNELSPFQCTVKALEVVQDTWWIQAPTSTQGASAIVSWPLSLVPWASCGIHRWHTLCLCWICRLQRGPHGTTNGTISSHPSLLPVLSWLSQCVQRCPQLVGP